MVDDFSVFVQQLDGSTWVTCSGELDVATVETLQDAISAALRAAPQALIVDLEELSFIASDGLRLLVDTSARCVELGVRLTLKLGARAHKLIDLTDLRGRLPIEQPGNGDGQHPRVRPAAVSLGPTPVRTHTNGTPRQRPRRRA